MLKRQYFFGLFFLSKILWRIITNSTMKNDFNVYRIIQTNALAGGTLRINFLQRNVHYIFNSKFLTLTQVEGIYFPPNFNSQLMELHQNFLKIYFAFIMHTKKKHSVNFQTICLYILIAVNHFNISETEMILWVVIS